MSPDRLVHMANQIGGFFKSRGDARAVPGAADINIFGNALRDPGALGGEVRWDLIRTFVQS